MKCPVVSNVLVGCTAVTVKRFRDGDKKINILLLELLPAFIPFIPFFFSSLVSSIPLSSLFSLPVLQSHFNLPVLSPVTFPSFLTRFAVCVRGLLW